MPTEDELKLQALREKRAAFNAAREAALAEPIAQTIAREERDMADAEALAKAQDEFGAENVALVPTNYGGIVVKKPKKILYTWFNEQGNIKEATLLKYIFPCRVYPAAEVFDRIVEQQPDALYKCANRISKLAGALQSEDTAK